MYVKMHEVQRIVRTFFILYKQSVSQQNCAYEEKCIRDDICIQYKKITPGFMHLQIQYKTFQFLILVLFLKKMQTYNMETQNKRI